jgi:hypothetical protein
MLVPPLEALLDLANAAGGFMEALSIRKTADSPYPPLASSAGS